MLSICIILARPSLPENQRATKKIWGTREAGGDQMLMQKAWWRGGSCKMYLNIIVVEKQVGDMAARAHSVRGRVHVALLSKQAACQPNHCCTKASLTETQNEQL